MLRRAGLVLGVVLGLLVLAFIAFTGVLLDAPGQDVGINWDIPHAEVFIEPIEMGNADCEVVSSLDLSDQQVEQAHYDCEKVPTTIPHDPEGSYQASGAAGVISADVPGDHLATAHRYDGRPVRQREAWRCRGAGV